MLMTCSEQKAGVKLVSACLLGVNCRFDGTHNLEKKVRDLMRHFILIPICPEQLGGLPTPRIRQEIHGGTSREVWAGKARVLNLKGADVTAQFLQGAKETLKIAQMYFAGEFIGKALSPSCGCSRIYDGTFSGKFRECPGITAELLSRNGIKITSAEKV